MTPFILRPPAQADLVDIWRYSAAQWSVRQADAYLADIDSAFAAISVDPNKGRPCDDIRRGYRRFAVGSHVIFYRLASGTIEIVRIERHL